MAAQGAHVAARYDPKSRVLTAWFAAKPYPLRQRKRASDNPMEAWMRAASLDRHAVNGWLCEMVKRQSINIPKRISIEFRIGADLANTVQTVIMQQHFCGYSFGAEVDAFLDWAEMALIDGSGLDGDQVVISAEADLTGWSGSSSFMAPTIAKRDRSQPRGPALNRAMSF
jgi:hypothetical protein